jgi:RNA polymerase sigma factor (sigma-70 family)
VSAGVGGVGQPWCGRWSQKGALAGVNWRAMARWVKESDERLLAGAARDPEAFAAFYRRYERPVLGYFLRRTRDPEVSADLTAEVFAAALASCARFRPGETPASSWLFAIAQHKLAHSRRHGRVEDRARRRLAMEPLVLEDEDLQRLGELDSDEAVLALLEGLPAEHRDAVRARILEGRPYEEIAQDLDGSQSVVRKRVSRGLARLREQLGDQTL